MALNCPLTGHFFSCPPAAQARDQPTAAAGKRVKGQHRMTVDLPIFQGKERI
jgi:hypothetical protein